MYLKFNRIRESCSYYYVYETQQTTTAAVRATVCARHRARERVNAIE